MFVKAETDGSGLMHPVDPAFFSRAQPQTTAVKSRLADTPWGAKYALKRPITARGPKPAWSSHPSTVPPAHAATDLKGQATVKVQVDPVAGGNFQRETATSARLRSRTPAAGGKGRSTGKAKAPIHPQAHSAATALMMHQIMQHAMKSKATQTRHVNHAMHGGMAGLGQGDDDFLDYASPSDATNPLNFTGSGSLTSPVPVSTPLLLDPTSGLYVDPSQVVNPLNLTTLQTNVAAPTVSTRSPQIPIAPSVASSQLTAPLFTSTGVDLNSDANAQALMAKGYVIDSNGNVLTQSGSTVATIAAGAPGSGSSAAAIAGAITSAVGSVVKTLTPAQMQTTYNPFTPSATSGQLITGVPNSVLGIGAAVLGVLLVIGLAKKGRR